MENKKDMSIVVAFVICLALVGVLVFISINKKENMVSDDVNKVVTVEVAKTGDSVSVNYTGRLQDGTVFDSSVDPKFGHVKPIVFTLGTPTIIAGWNKGIVGMKVGEKKTLTIPPNDAYGPDGRPPVIPPNATLIFDVELVAINK